MEKYNIFLGSDIANNYDDAKKFTLDRVEEYVEFDNKKLKLVLSHIEEFNGNVFSLIFWLRDYHVALASKHLLENDISRFKDKIQYQNVDFRYIKISLYLLGELRDYKDFVSKRGYSEIRENVYCKNGNLITLHHNFPNIEFQYEYDSSVCK